MRVLSFCGAAAWAAAVVDGFVVHTALPVHCGAGAVSMNAAGTAAAQYTIDGKEIGGEMQTLHSMVLVQLADKQGESAGGIQMLDRSVETPNEGVVVGLGPGKKHPETGLFYPMCCAVGDKVLFKKFLGTDINYNGKEHKYIRDEDVVFVYEGEKMTVDTIKMIRDQILVEVKDEQPTTSGGLFLAPKGEELGFKPTTGRVVARGPGSMGMYGDMSPIDVEVGDEVKFRDFAGIEIKLGEKVYRVMKQDELWAKLS